MKAMEELLPSSNFLRVHKSYIVALDKIESVFGNTIETAGKEIPIGQTFKKDVEDKLFR
jgi:DNA-binding LytR/AlgR family response regulator